MSECDTTRRLLVKGLGALAVCQVSGVAWAGAQTKPEVDKTLSFYNRHTGESTKQCFWHQGQFDPQALAAFDSVLRDHRNGETTEIDRNLFELLHRLQTKLGTNARFEIISGYRSPATNAMLAARSNGVAKRSYHTRAMAVDIAVPGVDTATLRQAALDLKLGGVGFYPKSGFVHVDTGPVRRW
ncbi:DUF882 domain-containing protein [Ferrimonas aestuarii]|uniref:Murein endopeptidase K n=1 Tax=Ferrimonas aestuarii TaxID=2569539 RepID=A0A4U1BN43_9GAMM|nr:DUF882 domain-containing protein [Ferrimonas aestuarii]TKB54513.1 DUF882 domain-containing protein [Ferrimonas aestuarii]